MLSRYTYDFLRTKIKEELNSYMDRDFSSDPTFFQTMWDHINHNDKPNKFSKELLDKLKRFENTYRDLKPKEAKGLGAYKDKKNAYWYMLASNNVSTRNVFEYYSTRFVSRDEYMVYDDFEKAKARYYLWKYYVSELIDQFPEVKTEIREHAEKAYDPNPDYSERDDFIKKMKNNNLSLQGLNAIKIEILEHEAKKKALEESLRGGLSEEEFKKLSPKEQKYKQKMHKRYNSAAKIGVTLKGGLGDIQNVAKIIIDFLKKKEQKKASDNKNAERNKKYNSNPEVIKNRKAKIEKWRRIYESYNSDVTKVKIAKDEDITRQRVHDIIKDIESGKIDLNEDYDPYNVLGDK